MDFMTLCWCLFVVLSLFWFMSTCHGIQPFKEVPGPERDSLNACKIEVEDDLLVVVAMTLFDLV